MTPEQKLWTVDTGAIAAISKHLFPNMAACEAALESEYGRSLLAKEANNLFGMKQHVHPEYGTLALPTKEWLDGKWAPMTAEWVKYDSVAECFADRMATVERLAKWYPHYAAALVATSAQDYVRQVSQTWSTDPDRAQKVLDIYNEVFPQAVETLDLEE